MDGRTVVTFRAGAVQCGTHRRSILKQQPSDCGNSSSHTGRYVDESSTRAERTVEGCARPAAEDARMSDRGLVVARGCERENRNALRERDGESGVKKLQPKEAE